MEAAARDDEVPLVDADTYGDAVAHANIHELHRPRVLVATRGVSLEAAFQQLRKLARSSSRKLADLAQEVVQEAQRERIAALAVDDARVRAAEARGREAEQALQAAQTGLTRHAAALDRAQDDADERERAADERNHLADERERAADQRDRDAAVRDRDASEPQ